jgi:ABC-2 type transport system permease protein
MTNPLASSAPATRAAGTIYDLGYQHYDGPRYGRWHAIRTLTAFSFKAAFGRGRGTKAQIIPLIVMLLLFLPVAVQVAIASATGNLAIINYAQYMAGVTFFLALFTAAQSPEVIVVDRQYGVLSLYLSRSLSSIDYIGAKLFAFTGALIVLTTGPQLLLFFGKVFASPTPWQQFTGDYKVLWPILGGTILAACYMSFIGLSLASFSARRSYAAASVMAFFVLMPAVANIARVILTTEDKRRYTVLGNPFLVMTGFANWLFDVQANARIPNQFGARGNARVLARAALPNEYYLYVILGTCAVALILLLLRYRRTEV